MRKVSIFIFFCVFLAFSCDPDSSFEKKDNDGSISIVNITAKELLKPEYGKIDPAVQAAATGANSFAFKLSAALIKSRQGENFVFSPYSVWMPLAALVNAADAQKKDLLLAALDASGITQDDLNEAASRMLYDLTNVQDEGREWYHNPLKIVNAIFVDKNVTLRKEFAQTFMDFYRGSSINVDFSSPDAVKTVNRWASENTNGLISDLVKEFSPLTMAAIANAIYFSDKWSWEFSPTKTEEGLFYGPSGESKAFFMLRQGADQLYYEDENAQVIWLGFRHGGGLCVMLPESGSAEELLSSMTNNYFNDLYQNSFLAEGKLLLPRFSIENEIQDLKQNLALLGIPLFEGAPLTGLIEEASLFISDALHKAIIEVDEEGVTAAAVTVYIMAGSAGPQPNKPFEMICNRPFVFILYDHTYDSGRQILFTGIVNKP